MLDNFPSFSTLSGGGNSVLTGNVGANSGISLGGGGSHSSGNNYGLVGGSALHHSGLGGDSISSSAAAAASMGLPASPMSFSGISGGPPPTTSAPPPAPLISTSLLRQGATTLNRLEKQENMQHHHQMQQPQGSSNSSQISQQQSQAQLSQQQEQQQSNHQSQQNVHQEQLQTHALGNTQHQGPQVMGMNHQATTFGAGQQMMMLGQQQQQLQGHQLELQQVEQPMQHLLHHHHHQQQQQQQQHLLIPKTEDDLPHQIIQQSLQRSNSLLSPHMQRQDVMHLQRQHSQQIQAHMNLLQHQRIFQHQQQQQQLLQSLPQHLRQQQQQQHQQQQQQLQQQLQLQQQHANMQLGIQKQPHLEPGACSRRLMQYIYQQRHRPPDNNILFWRKFVAEYFAPRAKKRWCVSLYGSGGRQPTGVFPQDVWQCEICGTKPGRGFETTVEVLPRLCKIKYDSGIQEELLFVDLPHEYRLASGLMVLEYQKATQESIFEQLRVVREGQLRIIFSSDLKIVSWEFCARSHEEFLPRKMIVSEVTQLATVAQKYQTSVTQSGSNGLSSQDLESIYNMFVSSSRHVARNLEAPTVNDLGYTKRYVRCLQISEVVNSMKDLIDFSHETNQGPIESLMSFPRRSASSNQNQSIHQQQQQQHQHQHQQEQLSLQALVQDENIPTMNSGQHVMNRHIGNGGVSMNGTSNATLLGSFPSIVQQNSLSMLQTPKSLVSSVQNPGSMQNVLHSHPNALSSFQMNSSIQSPTVNNLEGNAGSLLQQVSLQSGQGTQHDTQNVVHHFLQEVMNAQLSNGGQFQQGLNTPSSGGGNMGNVLNGVNTTGSLHTSGNNANMANCLGSSNSNLGGLVNNSVAGLPSLGNGLRNIGGNHHLSSMASMNSLNGRLSMAAVSAAAQQQNIQLQDSSTSLHDVAGNGILNGVGAGAGYNNLQFNWKSS